MHFRNSIVGALLAGAIAAQAQGSYPDRTITLVAPFAAGGDADQSGRNLAVFAQGRLGQAVVILNKAGASGAIGSQYVRDAAPDGYTLLVARVGSQAVLPALKADLGYRWNDFTFIGLLEVNPVVCVVAADSPFKRFQDLTAAIRKTPGKLNYSSSGPATILNLTPQLLLQTLGLPATAAVNVSYKGGSDAAVAVISHQVDFSCANLSSMLGLINGGKLRPLVTTTPERLKEIPDTPTAREAGLPQLEAIVGWSALFGPPKLPAEVVARWTEVLAQAARDNGWVSRNAVYGGVPRVLAPTQTAEFVQAQFKLYQTMGAQLGIKIE